MNPHITKNCTDTAKSDWTSYLLLGYTEYPSWVYLQNLGQNHWPSSIGVTKRKCGDLWFTADQGFPGDSVVKSPPTDEGQRRRWHPTPVLLPGKSHGQRSLVRYSPWGCGELDTTERLHFHFSLSCIGEGNGNPLQRSCLENSRDGKPGWLPSMGSHRVGHDWSDSAEKENEAQRTKCQQHGSVFLPPPSFLRFPLLTRHPLLTKFSTKFKTLYYQ